MSVTVTVEKVGAAFALIKCHHRPEAEYEFTGEFLGLSHELKFAGKNLRELRETGCSIYGIYQDEYGMTLLPDHPGIKLAEILAVSNTGITGSVTGERITPSMDSSVRNVAEHSMFMHW